MNAFHQTKTGKIAIGLLGILIGAAAFWLALRDASIDTTVEGIGRANVAFVAFSLIIYLASVGLRAWRWHLLLRRRKHQPIKAVRGYIVGYAVNNILPARLGEVFRLEYTYRLTGILRGHCVGGLISERLLDMLCLSALLLTGFWATQLWFELSGGEYADDIRAAAIAFAMLLGGACAIVAWAYVSPRASGANSVDLADGSGERGLFQRSWALFRREAAAAGAAIRERGMREWSALAILSMGIWGLEAITLALVVLAVGIDLQIGGLAILLAVSALSTLIPTAPAYIGTYQLSFVIALSVVHVAPEPAVAAATIQQVVNIGAATVLGLTCLAFVPRRTG